MKFIDPFLPLIPAIFFGTVLDAATYKLTIDSTVTQMSESEYYGEGADPKQVFRNPTTSTRPFGEAISIGDPFQVEIIFTDEPSSSDTLSWAPHQTIHRGAFVSQTVRIGNFVLPSRADLQPFTDGISVVNDRDGSTAFPAIDEFLIGANFDLDGWEIDTAFQFTDYSGTAFEDNSIPTDTSSILSNYLFSLFRVYFSEPISNLETQEYIRTLSVVASDTPQDFRIERIDPITPVPLPASGGLLGICLTFGVFWGSYKTKAASKHSGFWVPSS